MSPNIPSYEIDPLLKTEEDNKGNVSGSCFLYFSCLVVLLGSFSIGAMLGITSPMLPSIKAMGPTSPLYLNTMQASWFAASVTIGAVVGSYVTGCISQAVGRKFSSVLSGIPFVIGLLLISFANRRWMLFAGRVLTGFAMGMVSLLAPVYIAEVSTAKHRGLLVTGIQLFYNLGILFIYGVGW